MKKNLGSFDRIFRILLAAVLAYLYFGGILTGTGGLVLVITGAVLLLTSFISFCPLYAILGINSCPKKQGL